MLLRDIDEGKDAQIAAAIAVIAETAPDILLLTGFDWDFDGAALRAFADRLAGAGVAYPHRFAARPNSGMASGLDLDGDGKTGGAGDAQGFGRFSGEGGLALLSRYPIETEAAQDFSGFLWRDLPGNLIEGAGLSPEAMAVQRLSSTAHWDLSLRVGGQSLHLLAWAATPPVFDGPEDRNGRRNHDEAAFWLRYLDGDLPMTPPGGPFVLLGDANLDPVDGEGRPEALRALLAHPRLQDPRPASVGAAMAPQTGRNAQHGGEAALDTADWDDARVGNMRVDYVLPSRDLAVRGAGTFWPAPEAPMARTAATASRHALVWVDISLP
ncbi:endonuclease/exonuclease/phosphatase family protein [Sedimentimonas flavescens]|uniref:endonuclease/exonuclease/phosphatase family protein n=1 Tax=Sedimentimonas flavescens TaxID=2851012 RepID=UPI002E29E3A1|nr:endonuclease/exonuclease/phosphatase family protein [Sedimentimonas flavescens]